MQSDTLDQIITESDHKIAPMMKNKKPFSLTEIENPNEKEKQISFSLPKLQMKVFFLKIFIFFFNKINYLIMINIKIKMISYLLT